MNKLTEIGEEVKRVCQSNSSRKVYVHVNKLTQERIEIESKELGYSSPLSYLNSIWKENKHESIMGQGVVLVSRTSSAPTSRDFIVSLNKLTTLL